MSDEKREPNEFTKDEARMVIKAIEDVEREESEQIAFEKQQQQQQQ